MQHDSEHLSYFKHQLFQEIYRPGTAISDASNLCTAVGGDQNKEFIGNASFLMEKGTRGGKVIYIRSSLIINLFFVGLQYHIRAVVLSLQLLWGHWVCLHSFHIMQYIICVYLSWKFLFIICDIVYNLYYCYYAKASSPAAQIRHSKVYGNPIAPPCI